MLLESFEKGGSYRTKVALTRVKKTRRDSNWTKIIMVFMVVPVSYDIVFRITKYVAVLILHIMFIVEGSVNNSVDFIPYVCRSISQLIDLFVC